ncbi:MAG: response regulator [Candidatus Omnitrophica bacterium]|nr:response regulator [Candidatus Omnitrophota bacterium]MDD5352164.1 response regulator [Candidatus Omnitrophota bacterium]MDD5549762.1 response regulator [Candidatus Omnitrophota bacterium]
MKKRILMIDDEEDFCYFTKKNLEKTREFEVIFENSPEKGIATAIEQKPDLILLDIIMPEMDGSEVAFRLVNDARTKDIPIIFLTCLAEEKELGRYDGLNLVGGRPFIPKPCQTPELVRVIKEVLERKK